MQPDDRTLEQLPHTLYDKTHATATSYSKVPWGLHVPLEISGLCTRMLCSEDSGWGQWGPRYALHARRQSNDKAFRYLKRVIVTPAVWQSFVPLKRSFGYCYWADVTGCTKPYGFAASCVFVKQSGPPSQCPLHSPPILARMQGPLMPKARG